MPMTKSILHHMQKALSLFPILVQLLPTFSFEDLSRSPPIAVSLIPTVTLLCSLMSSSFAQSLWHIPLSPHQCLTLLMLGTIYPGIFLETSQAFIQLLCFASSSGPGSLSHFEHCLRNVQKCWTPKLEVFVSGKERWERNHIALAASTLTILMQDFINLVIWNSKLCLDTAHPVLIFSYPPHPPAAHF